MPFATWLARGLVGALAFRLSLLLWWQAQGSTSVRPYHVYTAATWLIVVGLASAWWRSRHAPPTAPQTTGRESVEGWWWPAFVGAALVVYWPALFVGALSDDFVLVERAATWSVGPVTPILFRPLPLGVWALLLSIGGGELSLHALSVVLHGTNAYLTSRLAENWLSTRLSAVLAGIWMLVAPLHGEAVVWLSGIFDVMATTALLAAVLALGRYTDDVHGGPRWSTRLAFFLASAAAIASKETAVVLPLLGIVVLAPRWKRMSRTCVADLVVVGLTLAAYGTMRALNADAMAGAWQVGRYELQRSVFSTFGTLAVPWRTPHASSALVLLATMATIALWARAFMVGDRRTLKPAILGCGWVLAAILPVLPSLTIGDTLEGSRYLYTASAGWGVALAALTVTATSPAWRASWPMAVVFAITAGSAVGARVYIEPWTRAANLRDAVLAKARAESRFASCERVRLTNLPDAVDGAYVFRNGAPEAFTHALGVSLDDNATANCRFRWANEAAGFVAEEPAGRD